jgi:hypothetical protein
MMAPSIESLRNDLRAMVRAYDRFQEGRGATPQRLILEHGREFAAVPRPKNFRPRKPKNCFGNAFSLALEGRAEYCEGFASSASGITTAFAHAWACTVDGTLVETTLREPENYAYLGIRFPPEIFRQLVDRRCREPDFGCWGFLMEPFARELLGELN